MSKNVNTKKHKVSYVKSMPKSSNDEKITWKAGNMLYLKRGDDALMSFETDIYSNIYCADIGGRTYAAASPPNTTPPFRKLRLVMYSPAYMVNPPQP